MAPPSSCSPSPRWRSGDTGEAPNPSHPRIALRRHRHRHRHRRRHRHRHRPRRCRPRRCRRCRCRRHARWPSSSPPPLTDRLHRCDPLAVTVAATPSPPPPPPSRRRRRHRRHCFRRRRFAVALAAAALAVAALPAAAARDALRWPEMARDEPRSSEMSRDTPRYAEIRRDALCVNLPRAVSLLAFPLLYEELVTGLVIGRRRSVLLIRVFVSVCFCFRMGLQSVSFSLNPHFAAPGRIQARYKAGLPASSS